MNTTDNNLQNESHNGCLSTMGGCFLKVVAFIFAFIILMFVKTCSKSLSRGVHRECAQSEYVSSDKSTIDAQIYKIMDELRANLPQKIDDFTTQKDVAMDDNYFYYICDIDDSQTDFTSVDDATLKSCLKKELVSALPEMRKMIEILVSTNRGLTYRYHCTSSGIFKNVAFSKDELESLLEK